MINLLPPDLKTSIIYARRNTMLIKWLVATLVGLAGVGAVVVAGQFYINHSVNAYKTEVQRSKEQLSAQKLEETQARVTDISNSIKLATQVLSREVLFSKLLQQIGAVMPAGSSLQSLTIGKLEGGIDLQAAAVDYQTATQVQVNLEDPRNKIFDSADIVSVSCTNSDDPAKKQDYPCQVSIRASFTKNNPFLFVQTGVTP